MKISLCLGSVCLLSDTVDDRKTLKQKQDEERLLKELLEVVSLRNNIVDSIEVDRQRFALHVLCLRLNLSYGTFTFFLFLSSSYGQTSTS